MLEPSGSTVLTSADDTILHRSRHHPPLSGRGAPMTERRWDETPRRAASAWLELVGKVTALSLTGSRRVMATNERLAEALSDGSLDRMKDQPIDVTIGGRRVRGVVQSVRLRRRGIDVQAFVELREVDWDGLPIDALSLTAGSIRIEPPVPGRLRASDVQVAGRTSLEALVAWLDERLPSWALTIDDNGHVNAGRRRRGLSAVIEATVTQHVLYAQMHAIRWRCVRIVLPPNVRRARTLALPRLPLDMFVVDARAVEGVVEFSARVTSLDQPLTRGGLVETT